MILSTMPLRSMAWLSASRTFLSFSGFLILPSGPLASGIPGDGSANWSSAI